METDKLIFPDEAYAIFGACFAVYNQMGNGFVEPVYQECLEIELGLKDVPFIPQQELALTYRGRSLKRKYIPDFVCFGKIIVEIKAVSTLTDEHRAQVHNYLAATGYQLGLLINFGHAKGVQYERIVHTGTCNMVDQAKAPFA